MKFLCAANLLEQLDTFIACGTTYGIIELFFFTFFLFC